MTRPAAPPPPDLMERIRQRITDAFEGELTEAEALEMFADTGWPVDEDALQPYKDALRELVECVNALENRAIRSGGEFHVWAEERMLTDGRDKARSLLSDTEASPR